MILDDLIERAEDLEGEIDRLRAARDIEALKVQVAQAEAHVVEVERALAYRKEHPKRFEVPRWAMRAYLLLIPVGVAWVAILAFLLR